MDSIGAIADNSVQLLIDKSIDKNIMSMLIVGKGPSAKEIKRFQDGISFGDSFFKVPKRFEISSINCAWKIVDSPDYAFMGDYAAMREFEKEEFLERKNSIKRLVIPTYPHLSERLDGVEVVSTAYPCHTEYSFQSESFNNLVDGIPYYLYQLEGSPLNYYGVESHEEINSVSGSIFVALSFAISRGFRHFVLTGFDPDIEVGSNKDIYSNKFTTDHIVDRDQMINYYQFAFYKSIEKIISCGCTYQILK